jgi:acyl carrier protein
MPVFEIREVDEVELRGAVAEILDILPEDLTEEAELDNFAGYDSTARLSLMVCLSDLTGFPFELAALRKLRTYSDIVNLVNKSCGNGQSS